MAPSIMETASETPVVPQELNNDVKKDIPLHEENQYLDLIREILERGEHRPDGGTPIPILTTKRVFLRTFIPELLWFISGSTSSLPLTGAGIKIWDGNGIREYLDSVGLSHRAVGDLGPVYGFQWRHFGAQYIDANTDYTGKGVDQLAKSDPYVEA